LKKCQFCSTINQDYDWTCGVCGESLSGSVSKSLEVLEAEKPVNPQVRRSGRGRAFTIFLAGLATISIGSYLLFVSVAFGMVLFFTGGVLLLYVLGIEGSAVGLGGGLKGVTAGIKGEIVKKEAETSEKEEENRD
jgi:hypothetical protein